MRYRSSIVGLMLPTALAAQSPGAPENAPPVMFSFERIANVYGSRLVAAFDSIPANRYDYRPTPPQQTIGYIAQHLENANYDLCEHFSDLKHPRSHKDSLPNTVKAQWPKDTLVARLKASLRFCDSTLDRVREVDGLFAQQLVMFETDLAEHYSQVSVYMRLLGMVPPSALPPVRRATVELPSSTLSPLVGVYQLEAGPQVDITMRDGLLYVKSSGGLTVRLWAESPNEYFVNEVDAQFTVVRDTAGAVTGFIVHQFGRDRTAHRIR